MRRVLLICMLITSACGTAEPSADRRSVPAQDENDLQSGSPSVPAAPQGDADQQSESPDEVGTSRWLEPPLVLGAGAVLIAGIGAAAIGRKRSRALLERPSASQVARIKPPMPSEPLETFDGSRADVRLERTVIADRDSVFEPDGRGRSDVVPDVHSPEDRSDDGVMVLGIRSNTSQHIGALPLLPGQYVPANVADEGIHGSLRFAACSLRGERHRITGTVRQDSFAIGATADGAAVFAVADGLGSAARSHIGSAIAVQEVISYCSSIAAEDLDPLTVVEHVNAALSRLEAPNASISTTLVVAVVEQAQRQATVFRVGDSTALALDPELHWKVLFGPDKGQGMAATATAALPTPNVTTLETTSHQLGPGPLLIATDGVADPIQYAPDAVGGAFAQSLAAPPWLGHFSDLVGFSRVGATDDRTAIAIWHGHSPVQE